MSKAIKSGKQPFYEHPWLQDSADFSEEEQEEQEEDFIEEEKIEDDPQ